MIYFKFYGKGWADGNQRSYLPKSYDYLLYKFSFKNIKEKTFSKSIQKRLLSAKKHNAKIVLRKGRMYEVGIMVINEDDAKKQKNTISSKKKQITKLLKSDDVKEFIDLAKDLYRIGEAHFMMSIKKSTGWEYI